MDDAANSQTTGGELKSGAWKAAKTYNYFSILFGHELELTCHIYEGLPRRTAMS
jgi:hypothetical protein